MTVACRVRCSSTIYNTMSFSNTTIMQLSGLAYTCLIGGITQLHVHQYRPMLFSIVLQAWGKSTHHSLPCNFYVTGPEGVIQDSVWNLLGSVCLVSVGHSWIANPRSLQKSIDIMPKQQFDVGPIPWQIRTVRWLCRLISLTALVLAEDAVF